METVPVVVEPGVDAAQVTLSTGQVRRFVLADALDRAWRTFKSGIGIDIALGVAIAAAPLISGLEWTKLYWAVFGTSVAKSVLQAVVSYWLRRRSTPKTGLQVK